MTPDTPPESRPLKIAMFTEAYPPIVSGVAVATRTLVEGLRTLGHQVDVYAPYHPDQPADETGVTRLPAVPVPLPGWIPISMPLTPMAFNDIAAKSYDIAHTQHPFLLGTVARALARRLDIPLVVTVHTQYEQYVHYWTPWHEPGRWIVRQIIREFCNTCDQVVTVAAGMEALLREYGVTVGIEVIPNDVDSGDFLNASGEGVREELGLAPGETFILSVSRIASEKNLLFMLESVAPLLEAKNARLVFVGDGPQRAELERRASDLGLNHRVAFAGKLPHEQTARYYAAADLFLITSVTEVNPLTIGESLAAGTPVVAVDSFSAREGMVDGHDGLISALDTDAFRHAVATLLDDPAQRERMAASARETARRRSSGSATERTDALYAGLLGSGHHEENLGGNEETKK
ncbi:MAG TPA: glycosyltransferase [Armatimonadota bacterium]|jgi:glycosyltransferase involved in cell wall biosynthesis